MQTTAAPEQPEVICPVTYSVRSGVTERRTHVRLPRPPARKTLRFRNMVFHVSRDTGGEMWPYDQVGITVRLPGVALPLATSSFTLPDFRTQRLVNQLDPDGFTGSQAVYHDDPGPLGLSVVRYFCRVG